MKNSIDQLLCKIAQGDGTALDTLYAQTKNGVFAFVYRYLGNVADTEDCLQEVYIKTATQANRYTPGTNGRAWLLQIAKNCALDALRKRKRNAEGQMLDQGVADQINLPLFDLINKTLSAEEANVFILHVLWGYKHREIAQQLNCPTGTVTAKYKRSVAKLKQKIKEEKL